MAASPPAPRAAVSRGGGGRGGGGEGRKGGRGSNTAGGGGGREGGREGGEQDRGECVYQDSLIRQEGQGQVLVGTLLDFGIAAAQEIGVLQELPVSACSEEGMGGSEADRGRVVGGG